MLSLPLIALCLAVIGAYAKPAVRTADGLEVDLSTPTDKVASVSDLRVIATVKNIGDEDLKVLKSGTVLDNELPTRSFIISKDGKEIPFTGITVHISMDHLSDDDWVIIPAGKTVTAEHNVSAVYDFSTTGPGTFTFDPVPRFQVMGPNNVTELRIANTHSVSITITDDVSKRELSPGKRELSLGKRDIIECSDPFKTQFISDSIVEARRLNTIASVYINTLRGTDYIYKRYFGSNSFMDVLSKWGVIGNDYWAPTILDCKDDGHYCGSSTTFYLSDNNNRIHFCDYFFKYKDTSIRPFCKEHNIVVPKKGLRGGAMIHALALALGAAEDIRFGCQEVRSLPDADKIKNADNYECIALEAFYYARC